MEQDLRQPGAPGAQSRGERTWLLPAFMFVGAAIGATIGSLYPEPWLREPPGAFAVAIGLLGTVFLSVLKALVVPLIATSIVVAMVELGAHGRVARLFGMTAAYFLVTSLIAVLTGLLLVTLLHPGEPLAGAASSVGGAAGRTPLDAIAEVVRGLFPSSLVEAASHGHDAKGALVPGNVLGIITFSLLFGAALARIGARGQPLVDVARAANDVLFVLVRWIVWFAPLGILGLVAESVGSKGGGAAIWVELRQLGGYAGTVLLGLAVHGLITLPAILWIVTRRSPRRFAAGMVEAMATACGTASSAATLGVSLRCAVERNGVRRRTADFVLPIGATINMDGTALYEAVAVVFIAQSLGIELGPAQLLLIALTATLAAIGAAAIPQAGLVTMVIVLQAVDLPVEGIGMILSIDWVLDRFRTTVNVWGDSVGAAVVDSRMADSPSGGA